LHKTLVVAFSNGVEEDKSLYESTYGLVFFATPHGGGQHVKFAAVVSSIARAVFNKPSNDILTALKKNDFYSKQNRADFLPRTKDFDFISFYETKPTRGTMVRSSFAVYPTKR
jgi:protein SERAC1